MNRSNFVIVLVETQHGGNLGAAARAMKNCGLGELRLVNCVRPDAEAKKFAVHAWELLKKAKRFKSLEGAVADARRVVGFTAKARRFGPQSFSLPQIAPKLRRSSDTGKVALVFGREDRGLIDEEIQLCTDIAKIPGTASWPVFNLAQAVLLAAYEIALAPKRKPSRERESRRVPQMEKRRLIEEIEVLLARLHYETPAKHNRSAKILARLSAQFDRAIADREDLNLWRGLLRRILQRVADGAPRSLRYK